MAITWAFSERPVFNPTQNPATNNFKNQQCSFETTYILLKLLLKIVILTNNDKKVFKNNFFVKNNF